MKIKQLEYLDKIKMTVKNTPNLAQTVKNLPAMQETQVLSPGWEEPLEKGMVSHSSVLAWRNPWTEEPDRLLSMELQKSQTQFSD